MILIAMLFVFLMYALLSALIIYTGGKAAGWLGYDPTKVKKRIKILWFAPVIIWLVWDLPTIPLHKYYCATQAGFFVYKTPEQWLKEHPEVTREELRPLGEIYSQGVFVLGKFASINQNEWDAYPVRGEMVNWYNRRIYETNEYDYHFSWFPIQKSTDYFKDANTNQILAERITFSSGYGNPIQNGDGNGWKAWLEGSRCFVDYKEEGDFVKKLQLLGEEK